jgi:DeoR family transcriptional regulator, glycerol-3-phosphate regulon repressor
MYIKDKPSINGAELLNERQAALLTIIKAQGFATVENLAERFDVSHQTVRRDIIRLDECGLIQRFHGGAGALEGSVRLGYAQKQAIAVSAKEAIGAAAAAMVPDGATIFLDVGTTVEAAARVLAGHQALRVFTNSMAAAMHFAGRAGIETVVTGGSLRGADGSLVGDGATALLRDLRFDLALIGLSGWDEDGAPMDFDLDKIAVKRTAIDRAHQTLALCDASKFERGAVARIASVNSLTALVTNHVPPPALSQKLSQANVELIVADTRNGEQS